VEISQPMFGVLVEGDDVDAAPYKIIPNIFFNEM